MSYRQLRCLQPCGSKCETIRYRPLGINHLRRIANLANNSKSVSDAITDAHKTPSNNGDLEEEITDENGIQSVGDPELTDSINWYGEDPDKSVSGREARNRALLARLKNYRKLLHEEKIALLESEAGTDAAIDLLLELQKPSKQRRLSANTLAALVTGLDRGLVPKAQVVSQLDQLPLSFEQWNLIRQAVEREGGPGSERWQEALLASAEVRNHLLIEWLPLAFSLARLWKRGHPQSRGDAESAAVAGLIRALDKFKAEATESFYRYAVTWILSAFSVLKKRERLVSVSAGSYRTVQKFDDAAFDLAKALGRQPSFEEIAQALGTTPDEVWAVMQASRPVSLDATDDSSAGDTLHDCIAGPAPPHRLLGYEQLAMVERVADLLRGLDISERIALLLNLELDLFNPECARLVPLEEARTRILEHLLSKLSEA